MCQYQVYGKATSHPINIFLGVMEESSVPMMLSKTYRCIRSFTFGSVSVIVVMAVFYLDVSYYSIATASSIGQDEIDLQQVPNEALSSQTQQWDLKNALDVHSFGRHRPKRRAKVAKVTAGIWERRSYLADPASVCSCVSFLMLKSQAHDFQLNPNYLLA